MSQPAAPPASSNGSPSDDQILEMLLYAEQHSERAALERYQITRRQLSEWRAWVGARVRSAEEVRALLREGAEAERAAKLPEFLRRHNMTSEEYMDHKATAGAADAAKQAAGGGDGFAHWDTERPGASVVWVDEPAASDAPAQAAAEPPIDKPSADAIMRRNPGDGLTRAQICYLGTLLLDGKHTITTLRQQYRIGAGTMSSIYQGNHKLLSRTLKQQLAAHRQARLLTHPGRPKALKAPPPAAKKPTTPVIKITEQKPMMRPVRPTRPQPTAATTTPQQPAQLSLSAISSQPQPPPPLADAGEANRAAQLAAENAALRRITLRLLLQLEAAEAGGDALC